MSQSTPSNKVPQDLKPSFESRGTPATSTSTLYTYRSLAGDLADMATAKRKSVPSLAKSIDAVLDTPAAIAPSLRPLAKLRPSWIGPARPDRPKTPGLETMKQHIVIEYMSVGLQPPVYIFTDLSEPQWEAVEMQAAKAADGQYKFSKAFEVEEGEYQYKFRLGPGDWWVCDENVATVDDGFGNKNNLIHVKSALSKGELSNTEVSKTEQGKAVPPKTSAAEKPSTISASGPSPMQTNQSPHHPPTATSPTTEHKTPQAITMSHDAWSPPVGAQSQQTPEREKADPIAQDDDPDVSASQKQDESDTTTTIEFDTRSDDDTNAEESNSSSYNDTDDDDMPMSPLLRHESLRPSSKEQSHAPLFRHEATSLANHRHDLESITKPSRNSPARARYTTASPKLAEPQTYKLVEVPSDFASVMSLVHRVSMTAPHPLDDMFDTHIHDDHPISRASSGSSFSSTPLASVSEEIDDEAEEELMKLRHVEEKVFEHAEASGEEMDPLVDVHTSETEGDEPEDSDFAPKIIVEERFVVEVVERRKSLKDDLCERIGGKQNALALALGLIAIAAAMISTRFL